MKHFAGILVCVLGLLLVGCNVEEVGENELHFQIDVEESLRIYSEYNEHLNALDREFYNPMTTDERKIEINREVDRIHNLLVGIGMAAINTSFGNKTKFSFSLTEQPSTGENMPPPQSLPSLRTTRPNQDQDQDPVVP